MYEQELPCNLDDFPNYHLRQPVESEKLSGDEESRRQTAKKYLQQLEKILRQKISSPQQRQAAVDNALELYDTLFNKTYCTTLFKEFAFPTGDEVEEYSSEDFDTTVKLLYNENCYRHCFQRLFSSFNLQTAVDSWRNYEMLFQYLNNKQNLDLPIPPSQVWDILDEFTYQFYMCSRWRKSLKGDELAQVSKITGFWNYEEVLQMLESFYSQRKEGGTTTVQYIAHYAYLALIKLHIMQTNYTAALGLIEQISHNDLIIYSRAAGAYQSLFTSAGFCYLMTKQYKKATTTFSVITLYFNKYKQLFSKSYQYDYIIKQHEKCLSLLAICLVFYPENDDTLLSMLRDCRSKLFDKYEKITKHDQQALGELFLQACPKIVSPIATLAEFHNLKEFPVNDLINEQRDKLSKELLHIRQVNDVEQILKLYSKITMDNFNKLISKEYVELYVQRNNAKLNESAFESTILSKFWSDCKLLQFEVKDQVIHVQEHPVNQRDFINNVQQLNQQLEKTLQELIKIQ